MHSWGTKPRYDLNCIWSEIPHLPLMLSTFHAKSREYFLAPRSCSLSNPVPRTVMASSPAPDLDCCVRLDRTFHWGLTSVCKYPELPLSPRTDPWSSLRSGSFHLHSTLLLGRGIGQYKITFPRLPCDESCGCKVGAIRSVHMYVFWKTE